MVGGRIQKRGTEKPKPGLSPESLLALLAAAFPESTSERLVAARDAITSAQSNPQTVDSQPVKDLDIDVLSNTFSLKYSSKLVDYKVHQAWAPESTLPEANLTTRQEQMVKSAVVHLDRWLHIYDEVAVRHSQAICCMPIAQVLLEAIAILGGHSRDCAGEPVSYTPSIYTRMRLYAKLDLNYQPPRPVFPQYAGPSQIGQGCILPQRPKIYTGRFDYCIGFPHSPTSVMGHRSSLQVSHLGIIEAKMQNGIMEARRQLLACVGCLYHARRSAGMRVDCTSYGIASDGYQWIFLQITDDGTVRFSEARDIGAKGWEPILLTIIRILKHATFLQTLHNSLVGKQAVEDGQEGIMEGGRE